MSGILKSILNFFKRQDEQMSEKIHTMKYSWTMDYCLYIPAVTFNGPIGIMICTTIISCFFTTVEKDVNRMEMDHRAKQEGYVAP